MEEIISRLKQYVSLTKTVMEDPLLNGEVFATSHHDIRDFQAQSHEALIVCYKALIDCYGPHRINPKHLASLDLVDVYRACANINEDNDLWVFTTNYDCSFQIFSESFDDILFQSRIDRKNFCFKEGFYPERGSPNGAGIPRIRVSRLHGCVAWFSKKEYPYNNYEHHNATAENKQIDVDEDTLQNMQIKLAPRSAIPATPALLSAFQNLQDTLLRCKYFFAWGYSFRDEETLRVIYTAWLKNKKLKVYFADPFLEEEEARRNIRETLSSIPGIKQDQVFKPTRIPWRISDKNETYAALIKTLKGMIK